MHFPKRAVLAVIFILVFVHVSASVQIVNGVSGHITSMVEDGSGFMWFGTKQGLYRYSGSVYTRYRSSQDPSDISDDCIQDLCNDSDGRVWIGTASGIVMISDGVVHNPVNSFHIPVYKLLDFDSGHIVAAVRDGILKVTKDTFQGVALHRDLGLNGSLRMVKSGNGDIWYAKHLDGVFSFTVLDRDFSVKAVIPLEGVGRLDCLGVSPDNSVVAATDRGFLCYDANTCRQIRTPEGLRGLTASGGVHFMSVYRESYLLVGIHGEGLFTFDTRSGRVEKIFPGQNLNSDSYVSLVDSNDNIWLCDGTSSPLCLHASDLFRHYSIPEIGTSSLRSLSFDSEGILWFCSDRYYGSYDLREKKTVWCEEETSGATGMCLDPFGGMWTVFDHNKVLLCRISDGRPVKERHFVFGSDINYILSDTIGEIWVFMTDRISVISRENGSYSVTEVRSPESFSGIDIPAFAQKDAGSGEVFVSTLDQTLYECHDRTLVTKDFFNVKSVSSIFTSRDGSMWIGTSNDGLYHLHPRTGEVESFGLKDGLGETDIRSVLEDRYGNVWLSSSGRITRYDISDGSFQIFHGANLQPGHFYGQTCAAISPDGTLIFGGDDGMTVFTPSERSNPDNVSIPIKCLRLTVDGKTIDSGELPVILRHSDKQLSVIYSGINFTSGPLLNYAYRLEGFDRDWIYTTDRSASYNNLRPGKYTFRVKVRLFTGEWNPEELVLPVVVKPSLWNSTLSYLVYILLFLTAVILSYLTAKKMIRQRNDLVISRQNEIMKQEQVEFLTNTSHEFRTPLSLIYAPLKMLNSKSDLSPEEKKLLSTALENTERLKALADKSLRPSFEDVSDSVLRVVPCNISSLVRGIAENFQYAAHQKEIDFSYDIKDEVNGYADTEKVEKVILNILSNAFKYTPDHGKVQLSLWTEDGKAVVEVKDNGIGIPEDKRGDIFKRFNRLGREKDADLATGSGIGLNYAIRLARNHKGDITYRPNGEKGSVFSFAFPYLEESFSAEEMHNRTDAEDRQVNAGESSDNSSSRHSHTVLVAEDNADVRSFLRNLLSSQYNVITCNNGAEAWDNISILAPDVILSDIVMPMKDGYALCSEVKENEDYCHIPVILLTAKSDAASNIRGLNAGADAYIPKPFDPEHLLATIDNLLANRARVQQKVSNLTATTMKDESVTREAELNSSDRKFLEKLQKSVENHLNDESFKVDQLAAEIKMSHSGLYSKVKALTGHSPQTYINTYRMNVAMEMLKTGEFTIAEVADSVGSSSVSNFSRDFKKHFGITPSSV